MDAFIAGALAGYGIAIPVGAIAVLIIGVAMRCGLACGAAAGAGAATADGVYAAVAVLAGASVARLLQPWAPAIRWVSAAVLLAIAARGLWNATRPAPDIPAEASVGAGDLTATYGRFLGLTIVNPLTVVYFGTLVLGAGAGREPGGSAAAAFVAGAFLASLSWQLLLAAGGAIARRGLPMRARWVTAIAGNLIVIALAVRIAL